MQKGDKISPPFWVQASENPEDIVIDYPNPFDTIEWTQVIRAQIYERRIKGVCKKLLTGRKKGLAVHLQTLYDMIGRYIQEKGVCRVLDFGGGRGDNYAELIRYDGKRLADRLRYFIMDTPVNCEAGAKDYNDNPHVRFLANTGKQKDAESHQQELKSAHLDIVFICATLEYIIPYTELLDYLAALRADYFILVRNPMCDREKTFYCKQMISPAFGRWKGRYLGDIKIAIVSKSELLCCFAEHSYDLREGKNRIDCSTSYGLGFPQEYKQVYYETLVMQNREKRQAK